MDRTLLDVWQARLGGENLSEDALWGIQILWWGRAGKILEFIGAMTVTAELVGPSRLRAFGTSLRNAPFNRASIRRLWLAAIATAKEDIGSGRGTGDSIKSDSGDGRPDRPSGRTFRLVGLFLFLLTAFLYGLSPLSRTVDQLRESVPPVLFPVRIILELVGFGALFFGVTFIVPALFVAATALISVPGFIADLLIIRPLARILERPNLVWWITLLGVVLVAIGFHFDLLAS